MKTAEKIQLTQKTCTEYVQRGCMPHFLFLYAIEQKNPILNYQIVQTNVAGKINCSSY